MRLEYTGLLQILQIVASLATPLVVLVLGLKINKRLEQSKLLLSKEKDWQTSWAKDFLTCARAFNDAVGDCIVTLFQINTVASKSDDVSKQQFEEKRHNFHSARDRIQRTEWSLRTHLQFAPNHSAAIMESSSKIIQLISRLFETRAGDLNAIHAELSGFNREVRNAHRELLSL